MFFSSSPFVVIRGGEGSKVKGRKGERRGGQGRGGTGGEGYTVVVYQNIY